jgi:hypothetical protein
MRIHRPDRQVFGHALDEPQRQRQGARRAGAHVGVGDVVLEGVHQLVAEHVIGGLDWARGRQDDPPLERLRHAARPLADAAHDGVRLPEVRRAGVEDQRLAPAQLVVEDLREAGVPAFGHPGGHMGRLFLLRIEIDVEVLRLQYLEIKVPVLHLVAAEIAALRPGRGRGCRREQENQSPS